MRLDRLRKGSKISILPGLLLLVAGCQSGSKQPLTPRQQQQMAETACASHGDAPDKVCVYGWKMQYAIQQNFYDYKRYVGRTCSLTVKYNASGRYNVMRTTGDEALCLKAWSVVSSAENLPPPPDGIPGLTVDFQPH